MFHLDARVVKMCVEEALFGVFLYNSVRHVIIQTLNDKRKKMCNVVAGFELRQLSTRLSAHPVFVKPRGLK